jgi:six-hairpin glycosidase
LTAGDVKLTLIPYYAWVHRSKGDIAVWLPVDVSASSARTLKAEKQADNGFFR